MSKNNLFSSFFKLVLAPFLWLTNACSPIGEAVDKEKSTNFYFNKNKNDVHYSRMGNWFELGHTALNADVATFKLLGPEIAQDKNRLYFKWDIVNTDSLDLESIYYKDHYAMVNLIFDKNGVYALNNKSYEQSTINPIRIEGADPKTFERSDFNWAKDDKNWYYRNVLIPVDYNSFEVLTEHFSKDANQVFYQYGSFFKMMDADPTTFKTLPQGYYARDTKHLYLLKYDGTDNFKNTKLLDWELKGEDPVFLTDYFLKLNDNIYFNGTLLDLDAEKAQIVAEYYVKDDKQVYYMSTLLPDADATSLKENADNSVSDKLGIFRAGERYKEKKNN